MSKEMLELADKLAARLHGRCVTIGPGLREEVEAAVIALRASAVAEPVAPEAAPTREEIARIIYDAFPFEPTIALPKKPLWFDGGNSIMQDAARRAADAILALKSAPAK